MSEFATLEEAFGVASFQAPEPTALRGHIGDIDDARYKATDFSANHRVTTSPAEVPRAPFEMKRASAGAGCPPAFEALPGTLAALYADGGAVAVWDVLPLSVRAELVWLGIKQWLESDSFLLLALAGIVYLFLRK